MSTLGENIKKERMNCGYSQAKFAKIINTTQQRVSEWECDKVEPSLYNIVAIMRVLDISFDELIEGIDFSTYSQKFHKN